MTARNTQRASQGHYRLYADKPFSLFVASYSGDNRQIQAFRDFLPKILWCGQVKVSKIRYLVYSHMRRPESLIDIIESIQAYSRSKRIDCKSIIDGGYMAYQAYIKRIKAR